MAAGLVRGYLIDLDVPATGDGSTLGRRLEFQSIPPEIDHGIEIGFAGQDIPGRAPHILQDGAAGKVEYGFQLKFYRHDSDEEWVKRRVDWLRSLCFPEFDGSGNFVRGKHSVLWVFGDFISERCKLTSLGVKYQRPWIPGRLLPCRATCDLRLEVQTDAAIDYRDIRG